MLLGLLTILSPSLRMPFRGFLFRNPTSLHVIFWSRTSKNSFLQSCYRHLMNFILSCSAKDRFKSWNWKLTYAKSVAKFLSFLLDFVTFGHWKTPVLIYLTDFKKNCIYYSMYIISYNTTTDSTDFSFQRYFFTFIPMVFIQYQRNCRGSFSKVEEWIEKTAVITQNTFIVPSTRGVHL